MNIKHIDLQIDPDNPFSNCKLERKKYAAVLTAVVDSYADGFVLAINNEWGTGKTTFVKMWRQSLSNAGFETLYFNAWENDFESNPLVAILSELKTLTGDKDKSTFKSLVKKGAVLTKNVLPAVAKAVIDRYVDNEILLQGIEDATKAATEILEKEVESYASRKRSLKEFRDELENYLKKTESSKPVIFFIDELDRCKPNYAVEVLEQMKHFFAVKGIIFVLTVDKTQLGHAVQGAYGSEKLDANEYLRRFIDIEYVIPAPSSSQFNKYLFEYFGFDEFFKSPAKHKYEGAERDRESFLSLANTLFKANTATLRQHEKIFAHARLALKTFRMNNYLFPDIFLFLVYLRTLNSDLYNKIAEKAVTLQELSDEYFNIVGGISTDDYSSHNLLYMEVQLTNMYNNYVSGHRAGLLAKRNKDGKFELPLVLSKLDSSENKQVYLDLLSYLSRDPDRGQTSLEHLLKKINLIDPIVN